MKKLLMAGALLAAFHAQADDLPGPVKQLEKQGITIIKPFTAPGGVQAWLGKYQDTGVTLYLTPDKKHVITGYMYDAQGNNGSWRHLRYPSSCLSRFITLSSISAQYAYTIVSQLASLKPASVSVWRAVVIH